MAQVKLDDSELLGLEHSEGEEAGLAGYPQLYPAPPLGVVTPAQVGHALHALLVNVHVASCSSNVSVVF